MEVEEELFLMLFCVSGSDAETSFHSPLWCVYYSVRFACPVKHKIKKRESRKILISADAS